MNEEFKQPFVGEDKKVCLVAYEVASPIAMQGKSLPYRSIHHFFHDEEIDLSEHKQILCSNLTEPLPA